MPTASGTPVRPRAIVTGATSGIGHAIAEELARTHDLVVVGRDEVALARWADSGADARRADLADPTSLAHLVLPGERVDVLVHAAAVAEALPVEAASVDTWRRHFDVDVTSPAELTRLALPALRASQGTVVFIGSGASTRPVPSSAVYTAAKHALRGLADVLRIDEAPHRVRVATVAPGQTDTPLLRGGIERSGGTYEPERYIQPSSVARAVRFVVDAPADVHVTDVPVRPRVEIARL